MFNEVQELKYNEYKNGCKKVWTCKNRWTCKNGLEWESVAIKEKKS